MEKPPRLTVREGDGLEKEAIEPDQDATGEDGETDQQAKETRHPGSNRLVIVEYLSGLNARYSACADQESACVRLGAVKWAAGAAFSPVGGAVILRTLCARSRIAGAAPIPTYSVACVVGFNTTADWCHVKLNEVSFHWLAPAGSSATFEDATVPITSRAPHGSASSTTPPTTIDGVSPDRVVVSFTRADGSGIDTFEAGCG